MNRVVGIVAMVALVMHFTWGCCTHACHGVGSASPQVVETSAAANNTRCCHHGHRHRPLAQRLASDAHDRGIKVASIPCDHHCQHCHCTVTLNDRVQLPTENLVATLVIPGDQARLGVVATSRASGQVSTVLPGQQLYALCERFLI